MRRAMADSTCRSRIFCDIYCNISCNYQVRSSIPRAGLNLFHSIENSGCSSIAGICGVYSFYICVPRLLKKLSNQSSPTLICRLLSLFNFQPPNAIIRKAISLHKILDYSHAKRVDTFSVHAEAHPGLVQANRILSSTYTIHHTLPTMLDQHIEKENKSQRHNFSNLFGQKKASAFKGSDMVKDREYQSPSLSLFPPSGTKGFDAREKKCFSITILITSHFPSYVNIIRFKQ